MDQKPPTLFTSSPKRQEKKQCHWREEEERGGGQRGRKFRGIGSWKKKKKKEVVHWCGKPMCVQEKNIKEGICKKKISFGVVENADKLFFKKYFFLVFSTHIWKGSSFATSIPGVWDRRRRDRGQKRNVAARLVDLLRGFRDRN